MLQFFKDNLDRQLQFLGLVVGFWALMLLNDQILYLMSDYYESDTPLPVSYTHLTLPTKA